MVILVSEARVEISVYDVLGRRVAVLTDGPKPAGQHEVRWSTGGLATGVYFVRMRAKNFVKSRKFSLVK